MTNSISSLNLYSAVEDILIPKDATTKLYNQYIEIVGRYKFNSLIDIGCGSGEFLKLLKSRFYFRELGVDLSDEMIKRAKKLGLEAICSDIADIDKKFDIATATFDVINYFDKEYLKEFLNHTYRVLNSGGVFIFDINTYFGFDEVANGSLIVDDESRFVAVDSNFEDSIYSMDITLFKREKTLYRKYQESITQYYYRVEDIVMLSQFQLELKKEIDLYAFGKPDKLILVLKK